MQVRIGVYICSCGSNISENIDTEALAAFSSNLENVSYVRIHNLLCSEDGKSFLSDDIAREKPDRVVIAACTPREHEKTFRNVLEAAGMNPYLFQMVNIREQVAWATAEKADATEKAKLCIRAAVGRVALHDPLEKKEIECDTGVLVIGAGPAGMEAASMLARAGRKVYLVEKTPFIGGKVARYEEVFPTMECASCMLEPKMDEILHDENIELLTSSEVEEVLGFVGNFVVKIRKKATAVDREKCIGCGACYEKCPVETVNEFDYALSRRKALYVAYAGALPNVPVIDRKTCLRYRESSAGIKEEALCEACREACMFDAIDYGHEDEILERRVGGIVVATGFALLGASELAGYGYANIPEIYTALEFERILSQTGPTGGRLQTKDAKEPESIALIHCVGSRDVNQKEYCSGVCCLYALKLLHLIKKRVPGVKVFQIFADWCLPGKESQRFLNEVKETENVSFIRTPLPVRVDSSPGDGGINLSFEGAPDGNLLADMVVLCPAMIPPEDSPLLAKILQIGVDEYGFFEEGHSKLAPISAGVEGICLAGCCQGPKDIAASVAQGAAAAGHLLSVLVPGRKLELERITSEIDANLCSGCTVCATICPYKAIEIDKETKTAIVNTVLCKGCGACVGACPSGAAKNRHFTSEQIFKEIEEALQ